MRYFSIILVLLAAFLWGISGGIANTLINNGWSPLVISFYRGFIGFIFFFLWSLIKLRERWQLSRQFFLWSFLAGLGVIGNFTLYFLSIQSSNISLAVMLMYTAPVFVLLIALITGMERSTWIKWINGLIVIIGIILLTKVYTLDSESINSLGVLAGLASGLSYAIFLFSFKKAALIGNARSTLTIAFFIFSLVLFLLIDHKEAVDVIYSKDLGWVILLGLLGGGISFFIYVIGLRGIRPSTASITAMAEPITATLIGVLYLHNRLSFIQVLGIGLILFSILLLNISKSNNTHHK